MPDWPKFQSLKTVQAAKIVAIRQPTGDGLHQTIWVEAHDNGLLEMFTPTEVAMRNHCTVGDYAMIYRDGYQSVCPKLEFEDGYSALA